MGQVSDIKVRFFEPPPALRRYFTTFYFAEWTVADGGRLTDYLLPEWANLRFLDGDWPDAETQSGHRLSGSPFAATGPSSKAVRFTIGSARQWGIGLLPLGWSKFVRTQASDVADQIVDGNTHPAFASFRPLARNLFGAQPDVDGELSRLTRHFVDRAEETVPDEARIIAIHAAIVDREVSTVQEVVEHSGISQRTVERLCQRQFGFSPKLLLRRQRFIRSLTHFMLDPSLRWIGAIDSQYHDQAQFVRDFRQFMGMSPRQYAALPKPLIGAVMKAREQLAGSPAQTLDSPEGTHLRA